MNEVTEDGREGRTRRIEVELSNVNFRDVVLRVMSDCLGCEVWGRRCGGCLKVRMHHPTPDGFLNAIVRLGGKLREVTAPALRHTQRDRYSTSFYRAPVMAVDEHPRSKQRPLRTNSDIRVAGAARLRLHVAFLGGTFHYPFWVMHEYARSMATTNTNASQSGRRPWQPKMSMRCS